MSTIKKDSMLIRSATVNDIQAIFELVKKLAIYEKKKVADVKLSENKLKQHGFGETPYFSIIVSEINQNVIGYALYFFTYAATAGAPILYLEDLYVLEEHQNQGIGTRMLSELAKIADQNNCCRMEWHVFNWNESAIQFYESLGAELKTDLIQIRLGEEATKNLAHKPVTFTIFQT